MALETLNATVDTKPEAEPTAPLSAKAAKSTGPYALPTPTSVTGVDPSLLENMQQLIAEREAKKAEERRKAEDEERRLRIEREEREAKERAEKEEQDRVARIEREAKEKAEAEIEAKRVAEEAEAKRQADAKYQIFLESINYNETTDQIQVVSTGGVRVYRFVAEYHA